MSSIGVVGAKFWHGVMTARRVFDMSNDFDQWEGRTGGICTAASLAWCRAVLRGRRVNKFSDLGVTVHTLNAQMALLRRYDHDPQRQTEMAGLIYVPPEYAVNGAGEMLARIKASQSHIGIFWTNGHTMAYRYSHHEKEFFDIENGLYRAKYTEAIKATLDRFGYSPAIIGCRIVRL